MTVSDLERFKHKDFALEQGDTLETYYVKAPTLENQDSTHGGPIYVSVG